MTTTGGFSRRLWAAAAAALTAAGRRQAGPVSGRLVLPGLANRVEVVRDRWGVPHIYAQSFADLVRAQGYVQAQDRLWQMDFLRRVVAGRLSEVFGPVTLALDRWVRVVGLRLAAEKGAAALEGEERQFLDYFAAGVNAYISSARRLPLEFRLLRYAPEPWSIADSLSLIKLLGWLLSTNWEAELLREQLISRLGEVAAELEPEAAEESCIVWPLWRRGALDRARAARRFLGPGAAQGVGSNSWVVAGAYTKSGGPLLANDMHLPLMLPAIWHLEHLNVPADIDAVGVTVPGLPCVVAGFNGKVAWGITAGLVDVQDLYRERLRGGGPGADAVEWLFKGRWLPAWVRTEGIRVRGWFRPVRQRVVHTGHGPVVNLLAPREMGEPPLALRWTGAEQDHMVRLMKRLLYVRSAQEFREAVRDWAVPVVNLVYADVEGNFGYQLAGRIPLRGVGRGRLPGCGWTGADEWRGYIPYDELPRTWSPEAGFIVTANNRVAPDDYPHYLGNEYATDERARRIQELLLEALSSGSPVDKEVMRRIQLDQVSMVGRELSSHFARLLESLDLKRAGQRVVALAQELAEWDGSMDPNRVAPSISETLVRVSLELMLWRKLGRLLPRYSGRGPTPLLAEWSVFGERAREWFVRCLSNPRSRWFDLGGGEDRDRFLVRALILTAIRLTVLLGPDVRGWTWGRLHTLYFSHPLGAIPLVNRILGRGPYPAGGDEHTVWAISNRAGGHVQLRVGPPFRFVCDLGARRAWGILVPGQSGDVGSPHFDDGIMGWFAGRLRPLLQARAEVEKHAESRLELMPRQIRA